MKQLSCCLSIAALLAVSVAGSSAMAAPQSETANAKAAKRAAFLRGDDSTRVAPKRLPQNEAEAVATKRQVMPGVVEMELPEDRMVELVLIRNADGSTEMVHLPCLLYTSRCV